MCTTRGRGGWLVGFLLVSSPSASCCSSLRAALPILACLVGSALASRLCQVPVSSVSPRWLSRGEGFLALFGASGSRLVNVIFVSEVFSFCTFQFFADMSVLHIGRNHRWYLDSSFCVMLSFSHVFQGRSQCIHSGIWLRNKGLLQAMGIYIYIYNSYIL